MRASFFVGVGGGLASLRSPFPSARRRGTAKDSRDSNGEAVTDEVA